MSRRIWRPAVGAALLAVLPALGRAQVLHVAELNTEQIRRLDRAKTAVLLVGGILEQHGPYLPSYTDGYAYAALMAADPAHSELQRGLDAEERRREDRQRAWLEKRRP